MMTGETRENIDDVFRLGLHEGHFYAQRCDECQRVRWPVASRCLHCWSPRYTWADLIDRRAELHSFVTYRRPFHKSMVDQVPYTMAVATIDGARILARVSDAAVSGLELGGCMTLKHTPSESGVPIRLVADAVAES